MGANQRLLGCAGGLLLHGGVRLGASVQHLGNNTLSGSKLPLALRWGEICPRSTGSGSPRSKPPAWFSAACPTSSPRIASLRYVRNRRSGASERYACAKAFVP